MISDAGILTAMNAKTGEEIFQERLGGSYSASPILANGHLYFCDQKGTVTVIKPGKELDVVSKNKMADGFMSSPAVSDNALYLRSKTHLYRIED